jgi:hypothetical protein
MSLRTHAVFDHTVPEGVDHAWILSRLEAAVPEGVEVDTYWRSADPASRTGPSTVWLCEVTAHPRFGTRIWYYGPGGLFLDIGARAVRARAAARWSGFLTIEPLRQVHPQAMRRIAMALGANRIAYYADDNDIGWAVWQKGASLNQCLVSMERLWGPPQPSVEAVDPEAVARRSPIQRLWFVERLEPPMPAGP